MSTRSFMTRGTRAWAVKIRISRARRKQLAVGETFFAILNHVGTAGDCFADDPGQLTNRRQPADEHHQTCAAQPAVGCDGGHRQFFEGVDVVPQDLESACQPDIDQLGVFLQRSKCLADPLEIRGQNGSRVFSDLFGRRHDVGAHVFAGIAGAHEQVSVQPALGLGQTVANFLESLGEPRVIEHEANIVFGDPQALPARDWPRRRGSAPGRRPRPARPGPAGSFPLRAPGVTQSIAVASVKRSRSVCASSPAAFSSSAGRPADVRSPARRCSVPTSRLRSKPRACIAASLSTSRKLGRKRERLADRLGGKLECVQACFLELFQEVEQLGVELGPEPCWFDAELDQELCGPALGLGGQSGQQIERARWRSRPVFAPPGRPASSSAPRWPCTTQTSRAS